MGFIGKVELKKQLQAMGVKVDGNYVKKTDILKVLAANKSNPNAKCVCICPECEYENQIEDCDDNEEMYCSECEHVLDPDDCIDIKKYKWREK